MPRNSSGTYSPPANTAAVSLQPIGSVAFNTLETDVGSEITNSLDRLGRGAMQANLSLAGFVINNVGAGVLSTDAANVGQLSAFAFPDQIGGLQLSNDPTSPLTVLDVKPGAASDSTNTITMSLSSIWTKTLGSWASGAGNGMLDVGTVGDNLWYHIYLIYDTATATADLLASLSGLSAGPVPAVVTISVATPCVVTSTNLGVQVGACFQFGTTGALPTGITAGTNYFVTSTPSVTTFQFAATQGGSPINTTGTQSGVQTVVFSPVMPTGFSKLRRLGSVLTDGSAHILPFTQKGDEFIWATPAQFMNAVAVGTVILSESPQVPPAVPCVARIRGIASNASGASLVMFSALETGITAVNTPVGNATAVCPSTGASIAFTVDIRTPLGGSVKVVAGAASTSTTAVCYAYVDERGRYGPGNE